MNKLIITLTLISINTFAADKYGPMATRLHDSHEYIQKHQAPDYWATSPYYQAQRDSKSCSLATIVTLVNAAKASMKLTASDELATQDKLFKKAALPVWSKGLGTLGKGVTLEELSDIIKKSFEVYGLKTPETKVYRAENKKDESIIKDLLIKNEKSANDFIIVNFLQSEFTGDPEGAIGHIAIVAAFDKAKNKVLIMDSDRDYYEPYWVSFDTLLKGIKTVDKGCGKIRGILVIEKLI